LIVFMILNLFYRLHAKIELLLRSFSNFSKSFQFCIFNSFYYEHKSTCTHITFSFSFLSFISAFTLYWIYSVILSTEYGGNPISVGNLKFKMKICIFCLITFLHFFTDLIQSRIQQHRRTFLLVNNFNVENIK
jgi:hypothetical protein